VRRSSILVGLVIILVVGGALTTLLASSDMSDLLPVLRQTSDASASTADMLPWQAEQLFLLIGFILFNMIGIGATIALIVWLVNRQIVVARISAQEEEKQAAGTKQN
jgi:hypothetical protein